MKKLKLAPLASYMKQADLFKYIRSHAVPTGKAIAQEQPPKDGQVPTKEMNSFNYQYWVMETIHTKMMQDSMVDQHYHEMICSDYNARLYFDLDYKLADNLIDPTKLTYEQWYQWVDELIDLVQAEFPGVERPIIWCGYRPGEKFSTHLIYPNLWFDTPASCRRLAEHLGSIAKSPELKTMMDGGIYPKTNHSDTGVWHNLRLPLSVKYNVPNSGFRLIHGPKDLAVAVMQSFVQLPDYQPNEVHTYGEPDEPTNTNQYVEGATLTAEQVQRLEQWLVENHEVDIRQIKWKQQQTWHIWAGLYCPIKGDRHASNTTFMNVIGTKQIRFTCMDCRVTYDADVDARYVLNDRRVTFNDDLCQLYLSKHL
jgi:hypothetical protein